MNATMKPTVRIGDIARPISLRATSECALPVYSVTKHDGMVPSSDYFKKQVYSRDVEGYKVVSRGQFAYATIHLDEGSIGVLETADKCVISPMYTVFEVDASRVHASYLLRLLKSPWALKKYTVLGNGSVHRRRSIPFEVLARLEVSLPSIAEQHRASILLDKVDGLLRKRHKTIHVADEFLRAVFVEMFGTPGGASKWPVSSVANMVSSVESGWSAPSSDRDLNDQDLAVLKVSAVSTGWFLSEEAKPVDRAIVDRPLVFPRRGDLLFSRANTRELVAACCLVEEDVDNRFLPDKLWRVTADLKQATNEYLCYLFRHPAFRHELTKQATGTSGSMLNISQAKLLNTPAPLPPVALQQKFTKIVNRAQAARRNSLNSLRDLQSLKESLTAKLFG